MHCMPKSMTVTATGLADEDDFGSIPIIDLAAWRSPDHKECQ